MPPRATASVTPHSVRRLTELALVTGLGAAGDFALDELELIAVNQDAGMIKGGGRIRSRRRRWRFARNREAASQEQKHDC